MNKLFKFFMFWAIPLLAVLVVSCKDDEDPAPTVLEPAITSVTPSQGAIGTEVTITGVNLEDVTRVTFGGVNAADFDPDDNTPITITAAVPAGLTPGAQNITVTSAGGSATANFTVVEGTVTPGTPVITSFTPIIGPVGTEVTITGTDLDVADSAYIGDVAITDWEVNDLATEATFTIPEGAETGTFILYHGEDASEVESATEFTVGEPMPIITSFTPASGPVGTPVTIQGANLDMADSAYIGDVRITDWEVDEDDEGTAATFTIPEGAETGAFMIYAGEGDPVVSEEEFVVEEEGFATIESFDPNFGPVGTEVTITGTNLNNAVSAMLGEVEITDWEAAEDGNTATFTIPEGAVSGNFTLANEAGDEVMSEETFVVGESPVSLTSFNPVIGGVGTAVTLSGTNLDSVATAMIGEVEITDWVASEDGTTAVFTIPEGAVTGDLTLTDTAGGEVVGAEPFTVDETAQTITSFNPTIGGISTAVTVTGTNLNTVTSAMIGDVEITDWEVSEDGTTATFTIPEGATTGNLILTNDTGIEVGSTGAFTIDETAPTVASFDPVTGAVGSEVTITGTNLNTVTSAMIGEVEITDWEAAEDGTTATFTVPAGATTGAFTLGTDAGMEVVSTEMFTVE